MNSKHVAPLAKTALRTCRLLAEPARSTACKRTAVQRAHVHTTTSLRTPASAAAETGKPQTEGKKESILIEIQRHPFPRFAISHSGVADIVPRSHILGKALTAGNFRLSLEEMMRLANVFVRVNGEKTRVEEGLERWRGDVLNVFSGDLKEITRAASLFVKLSPNKALAYALYKVAAEEGYQNAAYHYAVILGTGSMRQRNGRAVGAKIIKDLAAFGHPPSQLLLAETMLLKNSQEETKRAIKLIERAAENGVPGAAFKLGSLYREGKAVEKNYQRALAWYEKASTLGAPEGLFMVGSMYSAGQGTGDGQPDFAQAVECFERAALGGNVEAQYNVGLYYLEGKGVEKNPGLVVEYWTMAAAERFPVAMLNLGKLFAEGKVVGKNPRRARQLLESAIECGGSDGFIESEARLLLDKLDQSARDTRCAIM
ncbi:HCP-like protein [Martensiomyces pterosporus]|nr:HCP-like protein [Martensiomyces pterosporus]